LTLGQQKVPWENFNVVSFKDFYGPGGDVEGRLAVCGNLDVAGFTVGLKTNSFSREDNQLEFALFVGHNGKYTDGSVHPDGSGQSTREDIFVGDTFDAPAYLQDRRTGFSSYIGDRDGECADAQQYFTDLQNNFASHAPNVGYDLLGGSQDGLLLKCADSSAKWYYVNLPAETMSVLNWYQLENCNLAAYWIVNIIGTGDVVFKGDRFPSVVERLVYNVVGTGRTINVQTGLFGNLLAPNNILVQKSGVTQGLVVVGNVQYLLQANKPNCIEFDPIFVAGWSSAPTVRGEQPSRKRGTANLVTIIPVYTYGSFSVGDQVNVNGEENCTVIGVTQYGNGEALVCQPPLTKDYPPNTKFYTKVAFTATDEIIRTPINNTVINGIVPVQTPVATGTTTGTKSSASTVSAIASLFLLCCLALLL
jgi:choice-of-anchor A domain-containing protein